MEWHHPVQQKRLWTSLLNYMRTRPSALRQMPDNATVLLVPEEDVVSEQEGLRSTLYMNPMAAEHRLAFVRLTTLSPYSPYTQDIPHVTGLRVEYLDQHDETPLYMLNGMLLS